MLIIYKYRVAYVKVPAKNRQEFEDTKDVMVHIYRKLLSIKLGQHSGTLESKRFVSTTESPCE